MSILKELPLGKLSKYISHYNPHLLFPILRSERRKEMGIGKQLPFYGQDIWHGYEISWLDETGKPVVAMMRCIVDCASPFLIESKSFKLYLNSFNQTSFASFEAVQICMKQDLSDVAASPVQVTLTPLHRVQEPLFTQLPGSLLDHLPVHCETYTPCPAYLSVNTALKVEEALSTHLLKSNCLVTGQPDWGSLVIHYRGAAIDKQGLLKYIVSFRNHHDFCEPCIERLFMGLITHCKPDALTIQAFYTRRGGLDVCPIRSTEEIKEVKDLRLVRQ